MSNKKQPKKNDVIKTYGFRPFDNELLEKLKAHAQTLDRSLNWLIVKTLEKHFDKITND